MNRITLEDYIQRGGNATPLFPSTYYPYQRYTIYFDTITKTVGEEVVDFYVMEIGRAHV